MLFLAALGGNLGAQAELFETALRQLAQRGLKLCACSRLIRTAAVGTHSGGEYLNAAALLEGNLSPHQVLQLFQETENLCGRERFIRWGPRTLDLDLLLAEDTILNSPTLILPHPAMWYRDFVLRPAAEIAGNLQHPLLRASIQQLFERLQERPLRLRLVPADCPSSTLPPGKSTPLAMLHQQLLAIAPAVEWLDADEPGDVFADVLLLPATADQPPCSYPLPQPAVRRITLYVEGSENALEQLQQLCMAIGCTR